MLFDLDGTILQDGLYVSQRVMDALRDARQAGYVLAVCSGRPICMINSALRGAQVMDYYVCSNGAAILDHDGQVVLRRPMSRQQALRNIDRLRDLRPSWNMFTGPRAYRDRSGSSYMMSRGMKVVSQAKGLRGRLDAIQKIVSMEKSTHFRAVRSVVPYVRRAQDGVEKMGCRVQQVEEARDRLVATGALEVAVMEYGELEITGAGVTKGTGVDLLGRMVGVDRHRRVAFGDGGNDLPMMEAADRFVAMGNAMDQVKARATDVCDTIQNDGVATWIRQNLLA
ncbi:MAG: HAD-IIB family hydrolase [Atopobiaceae bacterium]